MIHRVCDPADCPRTYELWRFGHDRKLSFPLIAERHAGHVGFSPVLGANDSGERSAAARQI